MCQLPRLVAVSEGLHIQSSHEPWALRRLRLGISSIDGASIQLTGAIFVLHEGTQNAQPANDIAANAPPPDVTCAEPHLRTATLAQLYLRGHMPARETADEAASVRWQQPGAVAAARQPSRAAQTPRLLLGKKRSSYLVQCTNGGISLQNSQPASGRSKKSKIRIRTPDLH